jgi:signal transduction histidine kinase
LSNAFDEVSKLDEKWLKLIVQETNQGTEFRFIDSGKGVPDEVQEKIFRPFFTTKEIGKGTGLGLSLSYSIVKKHKGSLRIDNSCENTCFVVTIP